MDKPISYMMTKIVTTVNIDDTLERVEDVLNSLHLSSVPVVDAKGDVFGIISATDLLRFRKQGMSNRAVRAWEMCTYKPIKVDPETRALDVAKLMVKNRIHHVIVCQGDSVQGFVSTFDFVGKLVGEQS